LAWKIEFSPEAKKNLAKLDRPVAQRITRFFAERVASLENPRTVAAKLAGDTYDDIWRFRVGDYRILTRILDDRIVIYIVDVGHRKEVYRS
jgi:mRNA interferase RelE/StbE